MLALIPKRYLVFGAVFAILFVYHKMAINNAVEQAELQCLNNALQHQNAEIARRNDIVGKEAETFHQHLDVSETSSRTRQKEIREYAETNNTNSCLVSDDLFNRLHNK